MDMPLDLFPSEAFPDTVSIRPMTYPKDRQATPVPTPGDPVSFPASVQMGETRRDMVSGTPRQITSVEVFINDVSGTMIPNLRRGDSITWGNLILSVIGGARDDTGYGVLWWIPCEFVE